MAGIDFGDGSWEDARGVVQNSLSRLIAAVEGNGKEGIQETLSNFITEYRTTVENQEKFQDRRDSEIKAHLARRDFWFMFFLAVLTLAMGALAYRH